MSEHIEQQPKRLDSSPLDTAILREMADRLLEIHGELIKPEGITEYRELTATPTVVLVRYLVKPWFSASIRNDSGAIDVYVIINPHDEQNEEGRLKPEDKLEVDMGKPKIEMIQVRTLSGTAPMRMFLKR